MLDTLPELLEVPVHVADGAQRVVRRQKDLRAIAQRHARIRRDQWRGVARNGRLDLRLARGDDACVEVDLWWQVGGGRRAVGGS